MLIFGVVLRYPARDSCVQRWRILRLARGERPGMVYAAVVMEERWRLFVAIELGAEARQAVRLAQAAARRAGFSARWVDPANAHLTLEFLGDTDREQIESLGAALGAVVAKRAAFALQTTVIGGFPNLCYPSVLWLGLGGALDQLAALQQSVEAALVAQGFPAEVRPFRPHLTLGRLPRGTALPASTSVAALAASDNFAGAVLTIRGIQLVRSELSPSGARYTTLHDLSFTGAVG
jgi:2'-5' RNA ligase